MQFENFNVIAIIFGLFSVLIVWFYFKKAGDVRMNIISGRPEVDLHQIYESFFMETGISEERFMKLWNELAGILELPAGRLLPSDRFLVELAPIKGFEFDDQTKDVLYLISRRCRDLKLQPESIKTIQDYILAFG